MCNSIITCKGKPLDNTAVGRSEGGWRRYLQHASISGTALVADVVLPNQISQVINKMLKENVGVHALPQV